MKVTATNWQQEAYRRNYKVSGQEKDKQQELEAEAGPELEAGEKTAIDELNEALDSISNLKSSQSAKSGKMKASTPDDSVGELASQLARAQTKLDVQLVSSKAMRALMNLQMSSVNCEDSDKKKVQQMIARMKKLIKRINKKANQLGKEEQMERQIEQAEKKEEMQKVKELQDDLRSRRRKRRKEENDYAAKETAKDRSESTNELFAGTGAGTASGMPAAVGSAAVSAPAAAVSAPSAESVSLDVTV